MSLIGLFMLLYLFQVVRPLIALAYYQKFSVMPAAQYQLVTKTLETTIRFDRKNPQYHSDLGTYLHQFYAEQPSPDELQREMGLQQASASLKRAVMLDPGDTWNYYELARLSLSEGDGSDVSACSSFENLERCLPARYFLTALKKSPHNLFLRRTAGRWLYDIAPENALELLQQFIPEKHQDSQESILDLSKFLYDIRLDYEGDLLYQRLLEGTTSDTICHSTSIVFPPTQGTADQNVIELGSDDGSAEWRTYLASEVVRVKKVICLPDNTEDFSAASLKIFMGNGGNGNFWADITIDTQLIRRYSPYAPVPRNATWHEIPFDPAILKGKSVVGVYIRVSGATSKDNFLQLLGDRDTIRQSSMFNFQETGDLSQDEGVQTGEYMIRLVLKK